MRCFVCTFNVASNIQGVIIFLQNQLDIALCNIVALAK